MNRYNLVLNRLYEDLRRERSNVDNEELGDVYKEVIELYNKSMDEKNYLQSFILIQDRTRNWHDFVSSLYQNSMIKF